MPVRPSLAPAASCHLGPVLGTRPARGPTAIPAASRKSTARGIGCIESLPFSVRRRTASSGFGLAREDRRRRGRLCGNPAVGALSSGVCQSRLISSAQRFSSGTVWKTSFRLTVIGIARTRPTRPQRKPQKRQAIRTVVPFRSSERPMTYGVTTYPSTPDDRQVHRRHDQGVADRPVLAQRDQGRQAPRRASGRRTGRSSSAPRTAPARTANWTFNSPERQRDDDPQPRLISVRATR